MIKSLYFPGIIFVKTKLLTKALKEWMNNDEDLSKLSPEAFTGVHAAKDSCGTTAAEQTKMLSDFKEGLIKILIRYIILTFTFLNLDFFSNQQ